MNAQNFNKCLRERIEAYMSIDIGSHSIVAPYAINNFGIALKEAISQSGIDEVEGRKIYEEFKYNRVDFGLYAGKATPEEIKVAVKRIVKDPTVDLEELSSQGLIELLRVYGVGVDCSGFVFEVLKYAFSRIGFEEQFINSLSWADKEKTDRRHAGVSVFAGEASSIISPELAKPGDLLLFKKNDLYSHIAVVFDDDGLKVAQSTLYVDFPGVVVSGFILENSSPSTDLKLLTRSSWSDLYLSGQLEIRRLNVLL